jgi:hypothetical protein
MADYCYQFLKEEGTSFAEEFGSSVQVPAEGDEWVQRSRFIAELVRRLEDIKIRV